MLCGPELLAAPEAVWETIAVRESDNSQNPDSAPALEVENRNGKVIISIDRPCEICVYTILGQPVTKRKVSAGTVRLTLEHRGIYILKAGTATRRINL